MNFAATLTAVRDDRRFESDVLQGLRAHPKTLPCQWFYDTCGSELFEAITRLPEYYLTRDEIRLLQSHSDAIAAQVGGGATIVEFGSGSSRKTPLLLEALEAPRQYVPVDIAAEFLADSVRALQARMPWLTSRPVAADLSVPSAWSAIARVLPPKGTRVGVYLGSSIGNFARAQAQEMLARMAAVLGPEAWLVIGVDSTREPAKLLPAYDDAQGVTAKFNLNLLRRINGELGGDFVLEQFAHQVRFMADQDRLEMHLVSRVPQTVRVAAQTFAFAAGETIHTENCHKYTRAQFEALALASGWGCVNRWSASDQGFGLYLLRCR